MISDRLNVISPPLRSVTTIESPSKRCALTDIDRSDAKKISSADACRAAARNISASTTTTIFRSVQECIYDAFG